ncbi:MAG: hypothetical protein FWH05_05600 [Oscillospiraceae bacterium]|nr:hypothetical protein [Oscillospiraceae bacterium]
MKNLAPQIETEDMKIIGELKNIPDRVISRVSQGVSVMTEYFGLESTHEQAKAKYIKKSKTANKFFLIVSVVVLSALCALFLVANNKELMGGLGSVLGVIIALGVMTILHGALFVSAGNRGIIQDIKVKSKDRNMLFPVSFEKDLMALCDKMNVDWHTTGLDETGQIGGGSTFIAGGIIGLTVSGIFALGQYAYGQHKKNQLKIVSNIVSYWEL